MLGCSQCCLWMPLLCPEGWGAYIYSLMKESLVRQIGFFFFPIDCAERRTAPGEANVEEQATGDDATFLRQ